MTKDEAVARLARRWHEQVLQFPSMRRDIPLPVYIRVNTAHVVRYSLLADYASQ